MAIDKLYGQGFHQQDIITAFNEIITDWNLIMAKVDADDFAASDYVSTCAMTLNTNLTAGLSIEQGDKVTMLDNMITQINAALAKMTADTTNLPFTYASYAALALTDTVEVAGGKLWYNGMYKGDLIQTLYLIKTAINAMTVLIDTEAGGGGGNINIDTNYYATYPISFGIDNAGC